MEKTKKKKEMSREQIIAKIEAYRQMRPFGNKIDLVLQTKIPQSFIFDNVVCMKCGHIEEKSSYAIAQRAMRHEVIFTCDCGEKIKC